MDEWAIYVWPKGHEEGDEFPDDFYDRLRVGLKSVDIEWEPV